MKDRLVAHVWEFKAAYESRISSLEDKLQEAARRLEESCKGTIIYAFFSLICFLCVPLCVGGGRWASVSGGGGGCFSLSLSLSLSLCVCVCVCGSKFNLRTLVIWSTGTGKVRRSDTELYVNI